MTGSGTTNSWRGYIVLSLAWLAVTGLVYFVARRPAPPPVQILPAPTPAATTTRTPAASATPALLRVDVAGAVQTPGVYRLPGSGIVADAIDAAGGPAVDADLDRLNKAAALRDGSQIYVPRRAETRVAADGAAAGAAPAATPVPAERSAASLALPAYPLDLNSASAEELDTLPGIGPAFAGRIIAGRPYASVDDLLKVPGIGQATLEKLRPYVTVR